MQLQPSLTDLKAIESLYQAGYHAQAEAAISPLMAQYPNSPALLNLLAFCQQAQNKLKEALVSYRQLVKYQPHIAEIHFNMAILLARLGKNRDAIVSYRMVLQINPQFAQAYFNLAYLLEQQGQPEEAIQHYHQAISINPDYVEAHTNLANLLQHTGNLAIAENHYRRALAIAENALAYFNLGTVLYAQGRHDEALVAFEAAIRHNPQFADAWNSLGETQRDLGNMTAAVACYRQALSLQPEHPRATYNLGEYYCLTGQLQDAIPYFEASNFADAQQRALQCYYKTGQFELFKQKFDKLVAGKQPHNSVLLATLAEHYASNFGVANRYNFCPNPMAYVLHTQIEELVQKDSPLRNELLHQIQHLAISERKQGRLYAGVQSAGNLLLRSEPCFKQLASLIQHKLRTYQKQFASSRCELIRRFPRQLVFASSWYLSMRQGGYLTSHIHEEGWLSGCLYLKIPANQNNHEGSFVYGTDGDDYPRLRESFVEQVVDVQVGDLVLFPSSLFHRTNPFHSVQERVCVAFDLKPG
jgi:uncharacterized protein (TIGR02466 family)